MTTTIIISENSLNNAKQIVFIDDMFGKIFQFSFFSKETMGCVPLESYNPKGTRAIATLEARVQFVGAAEQKHVLVLFVASFIYFGFRQQ